MTTRLSLLLLACTLTSAPGLGASAQPINVLFEDHFDTGIGPAWQGFEGNQWWENGWLHNQKLVPSLSARSAAVMTHNSDATWTDYALDIRIDPIITPSPFGGEPWARSGVLFRATNLAFQPFGYGANANYYRLDLVTPGDVESPTLSLLRYNNGVATSLYGQAWNAPVGAFDLRVTALGGHLSISANGITVVDLIDPNPLPSGGIAMHNIWESHARYDNVVVFTPSAGSVALMCVSSIAALRRRR